jgi:cation-transporting ATPase 13A3/4/5
MSVICKNNLDNKYRVFVKGSPEMLVSLCEPDTVPTNFEKILNFYTNEGYRVIALGTRCLKDTNAIQVISCKRESVECDLKFLGLLIMENKLKP